MLPLRSSALALAGIAWAAPALADPGINNPGNAVTFPGTVRESVVAEARATNARVYGIAGFLERSLFPRLARADGELHVLVDMNQIYGITRLPAECAAACSSDSGSYPYALVDVDTFAATGGVGIAGEDFGFYYAAAWTGAQIPDTFLNRPIGALAYTGMGFFNLYTAPLYAGPTKAIDLNDLSEGSQVEYVLGGRATLLGTSLHVGYLGSDRGSGIFSNLTQERLRLLVSAVLAEKLSDLAYLKAGFDRTRFLGRLIQSAPKAADEAVDAVPRDPLLTSLFARRLELTPPQQAALAADYAPADVRRVSFWTAHAEQLNLGPVDVHVATGAAPSLFLHEARVGLHTSDFNRDPADDSPPEWSAGVTAGYAALPTLYYYGVAGGGRFTFSLVGRLGASSLSLTRNDPGLLALFPYAEDAWHMNVHLDVLELFAE